mmetsp:Transcript_29493/g.55210  ORF Transcript_29493/g.55210 Transcript_29493/m.55210 type:complete len:242 (+) Transcript_29493:982-1707(+)
MDPALLEVGSQVIFGLVAIHLRIVERICNQCHLSQRWGIVVARACRADRERDSCGEVDGLADHSCLPLRIQDAVKRTGDGPRHLRRALKDDRRCAGHLQVWLVDQNEGEQCGMIALVLGQEPTLQVHRVLLLDLVIAVVPGHHAVILRGLKIDIVAHPWNDANAIGVCLVQKRGVVQFRIVSVEAYCIRTQATHDPEIVASGGRPKRLRGIGHEVVRLQRYRSLHGHGAVADAFHCWKRPL